MFSIKGSILFTILLSIHSASASSIGVFGLGFVAPQILDKANVSNPQTGEIVFDDSDNTFYGWDSSAWVAFGASGDDSIITSGSAEIVERANMSITGSACNITAQSGSWLASATRNAGGDCTLNFSSSHFSATPTCIATPSTDNTAATTQYSAAIYSISTSALRVHINYQQDGGGGAVSERDTSFFVICMGPR